MLCSSTDKKGTDNDPVYIDKLKMCSSAMCFTNTAEKIMSLIRQVTYDIIVTSDTDPTALDRIRCVVGSSLC